MTESGAASLPSGGWAFRAQVAIGSLAKDPQVSQCILEADAGVLPHLDELHDEARAGG